MRRLTWLVVILNIALMSVYAGSALYLLVTDRPLSHTTVALAAFVAFVSWIAQSVRVLRYETSGKE